jgi:hypothetical protein
VGGTGRPVADQLRGVSDVCEVGERRGVREGRVADRRGDVPGLGELSRPIELRKVDELDVEDRRAV